MYSEFPILAVFGSSRLKVAAHVDVALRVVDINRMANRPNGGTQSMRPMEGKTVLVTGPTSGIGLEIARGLATQGATLVFGCRNEATGAKLAGELRSVSGQEVDLIPVDLSNQRSIEAFIQKVLKRHPRLDVLVNNAGVSRGAEPRSLSADGIELTFATNVMGYFLLTQALLQRLKDFAPSRIVNVASTFASDLDLGDLQFERRPWDSMKAYAQSKACDRLLTWAFARRLEGTGVSANAMAPGLIAETGLYRNTPAAVKSQLRQRGAGRTAVDGADTAIWLACSREVDHLTSKLFENRKEIHCSFRNSKVEEQLWKVCEKLAASK